jgi:hypothetical protein
LCFKYALKREREMFLDEALKIHRETGRKIKPTTYSNFEKPNYWLISGCTTDGWQVEEPKVEVTALTLREKFNQAFQVTEDLKVYPEELFRNLCKELGL